MEERDGRAVPDAGMLGCDRELFAQVWSRVDPAGGGPVEPIPPAAPMEVPGPAPAEDGAGRQLQALVLECLTDGSVYRDLARRARRSAGELQGLYRQKLRQAKRLSAAYFLRAGVRYWPREVTPANPREGFFPALRERYLAEGRLARRLEELAGDAGEESLRALYGELARETGEMARTVRAVVERET